MSVTITEHRDGSWSAEALEWYTDSYGELDHRRADYVGGLEHPFQAECIAAQWGCRTIERRRTVLDAADILRTPGRETAETRYYCAKQVLMALERGDFNTNGNGMLELCYAAIRHGKLETAA